MRPAPFSPFIFGIEGRRAGKAMVSHLRKTRAAGILLLARNIESPAQVRALTEDLRQALGRELLITIDHECGWVLRFDRGVTAFPGNGALGKTGSADLARKTGAHMAQELAAMGIGVNLAPVLDVSASRYNPGIGIRSFGEDANLCAMLGAAMIRGHIGHGVAPCAKHFPGKGSASVDAHLSLPAISSSRRKLESVDLLPFKAAIRANTPTLMTSHAVYPALDRGAPSTFSRKISFDLLRKRLGFKGVLISDDLCMGAVANKGEVPEAAVRALNAGHDLLIVAHAPALQAACAERLEAARETGEVDDVAYMATIRRVGRLLSRYAHPPQKAPPKPALSLAKAAAKGAVEIVSQGRLKLPLKLNRKLKVLTVFPDFREVKERFTFEGGPQAPHKRLKRQLASWPARVRTVLSPITGAGFNSQDIDWADIILLFLFEARRFPGQEQTALKCRKAADKTVAVLLRSIWDKTLLSSKTTALTAHGYRQCQIDALMEALR